MKLDQEFMTKINKLAQLSEKFTKRTKKETMNRLSNKLL